jgi:hypothetical protein
MLKPEHQRETKNDQCQCKNPDYIFVYACTIISVSWMAWSAISHSSGNSLNLFILRHVMYFFFFFFFFLYLFLHYFILFLHYFILFFHSLCSNQNMETMNLSKQVPKYITCQHYNKAGFSGESWFDIYLFIFFILYLLFISILFCLFCFILFYFV